MTTTTQLPEPLEPVRFYLLLPCRLRELVRVSLQCRLGAPHLGRASPGFRFQGGH